MTAIPAGEVTDLLVAMIHNRCINDGTPDSGHEHRSVETLAAHLGAPGEIFEPHAGRQSVLHRVPGTDPSAPSLTLLGHTDVVPVSPAGWSVDPFEGVRSDGFIWGRGAVDMLNQTASMAAVFGDLLSMFHGHDERVSEVSLGSTVDHLLATVQRLGELTSR